MPISSISGETTSGVPIGEAGPHCSVVPLKSLLFYIRCLGYVLEMPLVDDLEIPISRDIESRLDKHVCWPSREYKLELEQREVYQDTTGTVLDRHDTIEKREIDNTPFYVRESTSKGEITSSEAYVKKPKIDEFFSNSGNMANLAAYVAVCKVFSELEVPVKELYPEGNFQSILDTKRRPDILARFPGEYVPIEVYNGRDFLNSYANKHDQLTDLMSSSGVGGESNPLLINRRSTHDYQNKMIEKNVVIVDTDCLLTNKTLYDKYESTIEFFHLEGMIERLPRFEDSLGNKLDGDDYDYEAGGPNKYDTMSRREALTPPEDMISDVSELPTEYIKRIRGGIQLHYVNTLFRRANNSARKAACLITQNMYNNLLRADSGVPQDTAIGNGWDDANEQYSWIDSIDSGEIDTELKSIIKKLTEEKVLTISRGDRLTPRQATHPQPTFSSGTLS